jgi:hypothetical protein
MGVKTKRGEATGIIILILAIVIIAVGIGIYMYRLEKARSKAANDSTKPAATDESTTVPADQGSSAVTPGESFDDSSSQDLPVPADGSQDAISDEGDSSPGPND